MLESSCRCQNGGRRYVTVLWKTFMFEECWGCSASVSEWVSCFTAYRHNTGYSVPLTVECRNDLQCISSWAFTCYVNLSYSLLCRLLRQDLADLIAFTVHSIPFCSVSVLLDMSVPSHLLSASRPNAHRYITNRCQISANMGSIFTQTGKGKSY